MNEIIKIEELEKVYDTGAIQVHALKKLICLLNRENMLPLWDNLVLENRP